MNNEAAFYKSNKNMQKKKKNLSSATGRDRPSALGPDPAHWARMLSAAPSLVLGPSRCPYYDDGTEYGLWRFVIGPDMMTHTSFTKCPDVATSRFMSLHMHPRIPWDAGTCPGEVVSSTTAGRHNHGCSCRDAASTNDTNTVLRWATWQPTYAMEGLEE